MKILTLGHKYELDDGQTIQFLEQTPIEETPALRTVHGGTSTDEVLEVLIDRVRVAGSGPNAVAAIAKLKEAQALLKKAPAPRKVAKAKKAAKVKSAKKAR